MTQGRAAQCLYACPPSGDDDTEPDAAAPVGDPSGRGAPGVALGPTSPLEPARGPDPAAAVTWQVIGVNTVVATSSRTTSANGIGFCIPSHRVSSLPGLRRGGGS